MGTLTYYYLPTVVRRKRMRAGRPAMPLSVVVIVYGAEHFSNRRQCFQGPSEAQICLAGPPARRQRRFGGLARVLLL